GQPPLIIDAPDIRLSKTSFSNWLLRHPGRISMHGSDAHGHPVELLLNHTSTLDTAPFHTHLTAEGTVMLPGIPTHPPPPHLAPAIHSHHPQRPAECPLQRASKAQRGVHASACQQNP